MLSSIALVNSAAANVCTRDVFNPCKVCFHESLYFDLHHCRPRCFALEQTTIELNLYPSSKEMKTYFFITSLDFHHL